MTARDIFGIILRVAALWIFVWGAWQTMAAFAVLPETIQSFLGQTTKEVSVGSMMYLIYGVPGMVLGLLIFRFAERILWFTYRK